MEKVFERPLSELFRGELRCGDRETILSTLDALQEEIAELPPPDYTGLVAPPEPMAPVVPDLSAASVIAEPASSELPLLGSVDAINAAAVTMRRPPRPASLPLKAGR
jgi:hypothetical protein